MKKVIIDYGFVDYLNDVFEYSVNDIWSRYDIPVEFSAFQRAVSQYRKDGVKRKLCAVRDYTNDYPNMWYAYETGYKSRLPQPKEIEEN